MESEPFTWHTHSDTLCDFKEGLTLAQNSGAKSLLILTCQQNHYPEDELNALLRSCPETILGGIYPMITLHDNLIKQGALIIGFQDDFDITLFQNLHQLSDEEQLEAYITTALEQKNNLCGNNSFLMFYDALMHKVEDFIDCLFECLDHSITIAGGGAGNLDFIQRPCIFTKHGLQSNVVLLVSLPKPLNISPAHGWDILQGPFLVSEAQGQTVQSLNYQPAFEVYSQAIENASGHKFSSSNFFDIAKNFPLGIADINHNLIVRDPILVHNNHLQCVGNVPINSMVYLLKGNTDDLITSTEQAALTLFSRKTENSLSTTMVFDCISRVLYMEDEFDKELNVIAKHCPTPTLFGVLSLGEIANSQSGAIRLLNKSTVISSW